MSKLTRREYSIQRYTSDLSYQFSAAMLYRHSLQCWRIYRRHRRRVYQLQIHWLSIIHQYWSISGLSYKCFIAPCQRNYNCGGVIQSSKICQHAEMSWVVKESELLRDAVELRPPPPTMCSLCVTWVKLCQTTFWFLKVQFVTFLWESSFYLQIIADICHDLHNQQREWLQIIAVIAIFSCKSIILWIRNIVDISKQILGKS